MERKAIKPQITTITKAVRSKLEMTNAGIFLTEHYLNTPKKDSCYFPEEENKIHM